MSSVTTRLQQLEAALSARPNDARILLELARTWRKLRAPKKAESFVRSALDLDAGNGKAWNTLGAALLDQGEVEPAIEAFKKAMEFEPGLDVAHENLHACMRLQARLVQRNCVQNQWEPYRQCGSEMLAEHRRAMADEKVPLISPFSALGFNLSGIEQRAAAEAQAKALLDELKIGSIPLPQGSLDGSKIRIGYLSADFRDNAAGHLLHEIFRHHDRDRFEITAWSIGPDDGSDFLRNIRAGVDHFEDLRLLDDAAAAAKIAGHQTDLLVDLMGFAGNNRAGVLARRPARVQVSWLGYCMTTGAPWIDDYYADRVVVPEANKAFFSEHVAWLPDSYQIYSPLDIGDIVVNRKDCGLPDKGFVFACFNMPEKVDPQIMDIWAGILEACPGSVLWLLSPEANIRTRYRERASRRGIDPSRLVFAGMQPKRQHLARLRNADLFLDTPLCNAHTTASDALYAGVPVLTCPGELLAQRVGASVCRAAGQPELIVDSLDEYRRVAIELAAATDRITTLKAKLAEQRSSAALFDVPRFVGHLEQQFLDSLERSTR